MNKKLLVVLGLVFIFIMFIFSIFRQEGLLHICSLKKELNHIKAINEETKKQNDALKKSIYALKKDSEAIEKIARQKLGLIKEDEIVYQLESVKGKERNRN